MQRRPTPIRSCAAPASRRWLRPISGPLRTRTRSPRRSSRTCAACPPLLIHVGTDEVLLDDAVQLADRAKAAGVDATLEVYDRMIHVWHWFLPMLDEAQTAVDGIGGFVRRHT